MAQYTPNFNLYEPDSTDDFADFRTEFNNNMNIIDQNLGGGGSGGHTIIDENDTPMTQRTGLEFTGNVQVTDDSVNDKTIVDILGGGGNVYGAFVDPSRVITSGSWTSSLSYSATEDCFVFIDGDLQNSHFVVNIDGVKIYDLGSSTYVQQMQLYPLRKGQTLTATKSTNYALNYIVYGLTQGTNGIYAPVIYSDNERVIGVWRDNKPLYQRTIYIPSLPNATEVSYPHNISDLDRVVEIFGIAYNSSGYSIPIIFANPTYVSQVTAYTSATDIYVGTGMDRTSFVGYITLRYTKTTDVAGSGDYNTYGVPTHHYSTSEQVIGTWIDGKPCYEITLEDSGSFVSNTEHIIPLPLNADNVRIMSGFVDIGTDWLPISLTLGLGTGSTNGVYCYPNKSNGLHLFSSAWTFTKYSIVIQYTKTTD